MKRIFHSLAARLTFYVLMVAVVIYILVALLFGSYAHEREKRVAELYTTVLQQNMIQAVHDKFEKVEMSVQYTCDNVTGMDLDRDSVAQVLHKVLEANSLLKGVGIAFQPGYIPSRGEFYFKYLYRDSAGSIVALKKTNPDYTVRNWYRQALASGEEFWTAPYVDYQNKVDVETSFVFPCYNANNRIFAVIVADIRLSDLTAELANLRPYEKSETFMVDRQGNYVANADSRKIMNANILDEARKFGNKEMTAICQKMTAGGKGISEINVGGKKVMFSYAPMPGTAWTVCSVNRYSDVMGRLGSTTLAMVLVFFIGLVLLLVCIHIIVKSTMKPMRQLTDASYRIARGDFSTQLPAVDTKDDLQKLHDAFAFMQTSLTQYVAELQRTTRKQERISSELSIAHDIQMNLLPKKFSPLGDCPDVDLYAFLKPAKEVGGDFYDFTVRDGKLFFAVGDVSGKGVPAAIVMAVMSTMFRVVTKNTDSPAEIVSQLNNTVAVNNETNMFVTMYVGVLDFKSGRLTYCNAGHNPPAMVNADGKVAFQKSDCQVPVGVLMDYPYKEHTAAMADVGTLLVYTDGVTEAERRDNCQFGCGRMADALGRCHGKLAREVIDTVNGEMSLFTGYAEQSDDLTMLCLRLDRKPAALTNSRRLEMSNKLEDSSSVFPFVESVGNALHIDNSQLSQIKLAIEEAVVNAIEYAYNEGDEGIVILTAQWPDDGSRVVFKRADCGSPFNPLDVPQPDITLGIGDRPVGGLGMLLIRKIFDDVAYERTADGQNVLTMIKHMG